MRKKKPELSGMKEEKILIDDITIVYDPYKDRHFLVIPHVADENGETELRIPLDRLVDMLD